MLDRCTTLMGTYWKWQHSVMLVILYKPINQDTTRHIMKGTRRCYFEGILCSLSVSILYAASSENHCQRHLRNHVTITYNDNLLLLGPPVNVTCNIFINSFGSITETTMVRVFLMIHSGHTLFGWFNGDAKKCINWKKISMWTSAFVMCLLGMKVENNTEMSTSSAW